jgi:hypothetical protein
MPVVESRLCPNTRWTSGNCAPREHPSCQAVAQHMGGDRFQPSRQILEILAACDIPLQLRLSTQLLVRTLPQLLHPALCDPLGDSYLDRLPFRCHSDSDQKPLLFLVTADGRQSCWATNALKITAEVPLRIGMKRNATSLVD